MMTANCKMSFRNERLRHNVPDSKCTEVLLASQIAAASMQALASPFGHGFRRLAALKHTAHCRLLASDSGEGQERTISIDRSGLMTVQDHSHEPSMSSEGNSELLDHIKALIRVSAFCDMLDSITPLCVVSAVCSPQLLLATDVTKSDFHFTWEIVCLQGLKLLYLHAVQRRAYHRGRVYGGELSAKLALSPLQQCNTK